MRVLQPIDIQQPLSRAAAWFAVHATLAFAPVSPAHAGLFDPPQWVTTDNGVELQRMTEANSKLTSQEAKRVFDAGLELANRGADEDTQIKDDRILKRAEDRFSLLVDELAPNYYGGYTNRANVRVARGNYADAVADYERALELAPLAKDAWVVYLNLGSTKLALQREGDAASALDDMQRSVELSKSDRLALLGRASAFHTVGRWAEAAADYGAVISKAPLDIQPFWLRYSLELFETDQRPEALGIVRRLAGKFDLEPECNLAACSLLWGSSRDSDKDEALNRWKALPVVTQRRMQEIDVAQNLWPPAARQASRAFLAAVPPPPPVEAQPVAAQVE